MTSPGRLAAYHAAHFDFSEFAPGDRVLDIGCGRGRHLLELVARGCRVVGVEPDQILLRSLRASGLNVMRGLGEALGVRTASLDGLVSCVVLPYTDERRAVDEWGRVLRRGGVARVAVHGLGFPLRELTYNLGLRGMVYCTRSLINTAYYRLFGRRLPGWVGDTLCQTDRMMRRYFRQNQLEVEVAPASRRFLGLQVFHYYVLRKT